MFAYTEPSLIVAGEEPGVALGHVKPASPALAGGILYDCASSEAHLWILIILKCKEPYHKGFIKKL